MYELYIKCLDGVWRLADLGEDNPAMNYSANNLAELKSTNNDYSQELRLPLSPSNAAIFEHVDEFDVITDAPYELFDCRLYRSGCTIAGKGAKLLLRGTSDVYETQIVSGNIDFFGNIKNKKLSELELGYVERSIAGMNPTNFSEYHCYAFASFIFGGVSSINNEMDPEYIFPFAKFKPIIEKIVSDEGFTLETNLTDEDWKSKAISLCSIDDDGTALQPFFGTAIYEQHDKSSYRIPNTVPNDANGRLVRLADDWIKYTAPYDMKVIIKIKCEGTGPTANIFGYRDGEGPQTENFIDQHILNGYIEIELEMKAAYAVTMKLKPTNNGNYDIKCTIDFEPQPLSNLVPFGGKINIAENIGFSTQLDLFNAFVQLYGLTVSVDNVNRIIRAYTFDKVIENKINAKDWSKKLDIASAPKQAFVFGSYGQNNKISFIDNDRDMVQDFGVFQILNKSLPDQKDLFSIKFEAGLNKTLLIGGLDVSKTIANIPLIEVTYDDNNVEKKEFKKGKPHLVDLSEETIKVKISTSNYQYQVTSHPRVRSFIETYYSHLVNNALYKARVLTPKFLLTEQDIEEFDQFTPIYIDYYGAYFYVNKIVNYGAGFLTECELIRLQDNGR